MMPGIFDSDIIIPGWWTSPEIDRDPALRPSVSLSLEWQLLSLGRLAESFIRSRQISARALSGMRSSLSDKSIRCLAKAEGHHPLGTSTGRGGSRHRDSRVLTSRFYSDAAVNCDQPRTLMRSIECPAIWHMRGRPAWETNAYPEDVRLHFRSLCTKIRNCASRILVHPLPGHPVTRKIITLNESWNYEYLVRPVPEKEIDCTVQTAELWFVFSELIELSSDLRTCTVPFGWQHFRHVPGRGPVSPTPGGGPCPVPRLSFPWNDFLQPAFKVVQQCGGSERNCHDLGPRNESETLHFHRSRNYGTRSFRGAWSPAKLLTIHTAGSFDKWKASRSIAQHCPRFVANNREKEGHTRRTNARWKSLNRLLQWRPLTERIRMFPYHLSVINYASHSENAVRLLICHGVINQSFSFCSLSVNLNDSCPNITLSPTSSADLFTLDLVFTPVRPSLHFWFWIEFRFCATPHSRIHYNFAISLRFFLRRQTKPKPNPAQRTQKNKSKRQPQKKQSKWT